MKNFRQLIFRPALYFSLAMVSWLSIVFAHGTIVYGTFTVTPQPPEMGQPLVVYITMRDPSDVPIEDARVKVEATRQGDSTAAITANFKEVTPGDYQTTLTLPKDGTWQILLHDQTFEYEETTAMVSLELGKVSEAVTFEFPKTTRPQGFNIWLMVVIFAPILAGVIVTVRVLSSNQRVASEANDERQATS